MIILCEGSAVVVVRWREWVVLVLVLERVLCRARRERAPPKLGHWVSIEPGGLWVSWSSLTRCCTRSPRHDWVVLRPLLRRTEGGGMDDGMARGGESKFRRVRGLEWRAGGGMEKEEKTSEGRPKGKAGQSGAQGQGQGGARPANPVAAAHWLQRAAGCGQPPGK